MQLLRFKMKVKIKLQAKANRNWKITDGRTHNKDKNIVF